MTSTFGHKLCAISLIAMMAVGFSSCKEDDDEILRQSKLLVGRFHSAVMEIQVDVMSDLVSYPFTYDQSMTIKARADFKKDINPKLRNMQIRMKSARSMEAITYDAFVSGQEIRGKKLDPEDARKQAKKLNFEEGDVLVRCYATDKKKRADGRDYFLVVRKNDLGDLKIHTYYD